MGNTLPRENSAVLLLGFNMVARAPRDIGVTKFGSFTTGIQHGELKHDTSTKVEAAMLAITFGSPRHGMASDTVGPIPGSLGLHREQEVQATRDGLQTNT